MIDVAQKFDAGRLRKLDGFSNHSICAYLTARMNKVDPEA
jgi:hypothetical protein